MFVVMIIFDFGGVLGILGKRRECMKGVMSYEGFIDVKDVEFR